MLQHEIGLPVSQDRQLCRNAARARQQASAGALGRAGVAVRALGWALGAGRVASAGPAWARGRALQATGRAGARRNGRAELAGVRQAKRMAGWAIGSRPAWRATAGPRGARHGRAGARGRHRQGRAGRPAGRPVRTWVCSARPDWGFVHPDSVFSPV